MTKVGGCLHLNLQKYTNTYHQLLNAKLYEMCKIIKGVAVTNHTPDYCRLIQNDQTNRGTNETVATQ